VLQREGLRSLGFWLEGRPEGEALLLGTGQQGRRQGGLVHQEVEQVRRGDAVVGLGADAELQGGAEHLGQPRRLLESRVGILMFK